MKIKLNLSEFNEGLNLLSKDYKILAPVSIPFIEFFSEEFFVIY